MAQQRKHLPSKPSGLSWSPGAHSGRPNSQKLSFDFFALLHVNNKFKITVETTGNSVYT